MTILAVEGQAPDAVFRAHLTENELWLQVCADCGRQIFFPRVLCPHCGGALGWKKAAGTGVVYSTTIVRQRPERGSDYNVALIDLDGGARMMSRVEGLPPADVRIGMKVGAVIGAGDSGPIVLFRPIEGGTP